MLTSFFGKSNPINYLILTITIVVGYFVYMLRLQQPHFEWNYWLEVIGFSVVTVFLMLLLDFIIRKNHLTKNNTYGILLFSTFLLAFPVIFLEKYFLVVTLFLFLALRRIMSFQSDKNIEKKILDASLWIALSCFCYFWSLLFFLVLYVAILQRRETTYKQLLIPIVGFMTIFTLAICFNLISGNSFSWLAKWRLDTSFDFSAYNQINILLPITIFIVLLVWSVIARFSNLASLKRKDRPNVIIILFALAVSFAVALASPEKDGAEVIFILGPFAVITANFLEIKRDFWFKEVLLWLVVLLPVIVFML